MLHRIDQSFHHAQLIPLVSIISLTGAYSHRASNPKEDLKCESSLTYTINESKSPIVRIDFHRIGTSGLYDMTKLLLRQRVQISEECYKDDAPDPCKRLSNIPQILHCRSCARFNQQENTIGNLRNFAFLPERHLICLTHALLISMTDGRCDTSLVKELLQRMTHYESELSCR